MQPHIWFIKSSYTKLKLSSPVAYCTERAPIVKTLNWCVFALGNTKSALWNPCEHKSLSNHATTYMIHQIKLHEIKMVLCRSILHGTSTNSQNIELIYKCNTIRLLKKGLHHWSSAATPQGFLVGFEWR
jgi:hypothetical protein